MPNIWTHILFADELAEKSGVDVTNYEKFFHLGAQGPDPFFYYNFWPWSKDKSVTRLGSLLHKEKCGVFFRELLMTVKSSEHDPILKYYALGFIAHHILDRNAHPYIIHKSGEEKNQHQVLETTIDTLLAKEQGILTWKTPVYQRIYVGKNLPSQIIELHVHLMEQVYSLTDDVAVKVNKSYRDMIRALKVLYDPTGLKNKLLGQMISPFSHNQNYLPNVDYLNIKKTKWFHPVDNSEESNESFYEILDRAKEEGVKTLQAALAFYDGYADIEEVAELLGNNSYETGRPC